MQSSVIAERHGSEVTGCPVMDHDFSRARELGAYWALANELRESCPHFYNRYEGGGYWVFTRHEAVRDIYKTPQVFSSASITPWEPDPIYRFVPTQVDAPDHIKYRRILNPWFSPKAMEAAAPMMREICRSYIEPLVPKGRCNFIQEFALLFPTAAFLTVIGVPISYTEQFAKWVDEFFGGFGGDPAGAEAMARALSEMRVFWTEQLADRRGKPATDGDLFSYLLNSTFDEEPLDEDVLLDMCTVLTLAGLDTTRAELGYMFHHLALNPDDRRRLAEDPEIVPLAVEETLRYYTIIFGDGRKVTQDIEFHGVQLKQGDMVYGLVSGANRDPRHWDRADEFVIDRERNNHFGFASGPHRCLGMHLARREMAIAVQEWLSVIPDFELDSETELMERGGGAMMALDRLPLRWEVGA
ncbi:MAG: cytochrome P450 [Solirubrobacteraceae bacterium]